MERYICKNCGNRIDLNFNIEEVNRKCMCGLPVSRENDAGNAIEHLLDNRVEAQKKFDELREEYAKDGNSAKIRGYIEGFEKYISKTGADRGSSIPGIDYMWRSFIVGAAGEAENRKDNDFKSYLKRHAVDFDIKRKMQTDLFVSLIKAYPEIAGKNDWNDLINSIIDDKSGDTNNAVANDTKKSKKKSVSASALYFNSLCEPLVKYIIEKREKAFAIEVFNKIKSKGKTWRTQGIAYIRELFSSQEAADTVFSMKEFNLPTRKFAREVQRYCARLPGFTEMPVWRNYQNKKTKMLLSTLIASVAVIAVSLLTGFITLNSVDRSTIKFNVDRVIEITYGEDIYMGDYTVSYNKLSGISVTRGLTEKNLEGFDPDVVGKNQTAYFKFKGRTEAVTIKVNPVALNAPTLTRDGNYVFWDAVSGADSYVVYVNSDAVLTVRSEPFGYDLASFEGSGAMIVSVRAKSSSDKYLDSAMSESVNTFKLAVPSNIQYFDGKLTWDAVAGAVIYEIDVNGTPYTAYSSECEVKFSKGNNDVTVTAKSAEETDIFSTAHETIYNFRLDAISSMTYADGIITWQADEYADIFSVYVDGEFWKDLSRNRLLLETDGFISEFGRTDRTIGIVCKSSASGTEPSEMRSYTIAIGRPISINSETLNWADLGIGASYFVTVNGTEYTLRESYLVLSEYAWQIGQNTVTVSARLGNDQYILGTAYLEKLAAPTVSLTPSGWSVTGVDSCLYSVNGGAWSETLPDALTLTPGDYTVRAKRVPSSADSFEIASDVSEIKINKAPVVFISVRGGALVGQFDANRYYAKLYYAPHGTQAWTEISSFDDIRLSGSYDIRATICARQEAFEGYAGFIDSECSNTLTVSKPSAPNVIYDSDAGIIYSDVPGAKFYYVDEKGAEHEIPGGRVSNMPGGVFRVYARVEASGVNTLDSENTPESERASVFNMNITLSINKKNETSTLCYVNFGGCSDISSITYSYKVIYYGKDGKAVGELDKTYSEKTAKKSSYYDSDKIIDQINYGWDGIVAEETEVKKIELVIYIDSGDGELFHLSASMPV